MTRIKGIAGTKADYKGYGPRMRALLRRRLNRNIATSANVYSYASLGESRIVARVCTGRLAADASMFGRLRFTGPRNYTGYEPTIGFCLGITFPARRGSRHRSHCIGRHVRTGVRGSKAFSIVPEVENNRAGPRRLLRVTGMTRGCDIPLIGIAKDRQVNLCNIGGRSLPTV